MDYEELTDHEVRSNLTYYAKESTKRLIVKEREDLDPIKAQFPPGYIRTISSLRSRWPFLSQGRQRTVACMVQLCDVNRWVLNTWDIGLTAGYCYDWLSSLPVVAICEMLAVQFCRQKEWFPKNRKVKFAASLNKLKENKVIDSKLHKKLEMLRNDRDEIHIERMKRVELYCGKPERYNKAVRVLEELEASMIKYWQNMNE